MDRLTSMQVFVKVAEAGSFIGAAGELGMSPAMVAKHIRHLEERLQISLIRRTTRRQSLTDVGTLFLERCRNVLAEVEAAENLAAESQNLPRGLLRLHAPVTFGSTSLASALPDYLRANPEVTVDLSITDRMVDLVDEGYDAIIRIGDLNDTSLRARALSPYEMVLGALSGLGILQPRMLLQQDIDQGLLVPLLPEWRHSVRPMHILTAPDRRRTRKLESLVEFLVARFPPSPPAPHPE